MKSLMFVFYATLAIVVTGLQIIGDQIDDFAHHSSGKEFQLAGTKAGTDKVGDHNYQYMYGKYLGHDSVRLHGHTIRVLEIGLGCNMNYGPGKSVNLWKSWFQHLDLHEMEYDKACVEKWKVELDKLENVTVHVGDQSSNEALERLFNNAKVQSGTLPYLPGKNQFDVIVDDGGHFTKQIVTSFNFLFERALKPGGVYFIEDVAPMRPPYPGRENNDGTTITWLQGMAATILANAGNEGVTHFETDPMNMHAPQARWVTSLEIHKNAAIIVKATEEDCQLRQAYCP
jgi:hypothetical protein